MTERLLSAILNQSIQHLAGSLCLCGPRFSSWRRRRLLLSCLILSKLFICLLGPLGYRPLCRGAKATEGVDFSQLKQSLAAGITGDHRCALSAAAARLQTRRRAAATSTTTSECPPGLGAGSHCLLSVF